MSSSVLCLLTDGFEEIETIAPVDLLRRAGADLTMASLSGTKHVTGRSGIVIQADALLLEVETKDFDLLLIPGGSQVKALREDGRSAGLAKRFSSEGRLVAAICAAPAVLHDAGLLAGRRYTAHFSVHAELGSALADERVVEDRELITSRGAGTAVEFGLALVRRLFGAEKEREIASAIMV